MKRALLECIAVRRFGREEVRELLAHFGCDPPVCAFCGQGPIARWDHLIPVTQGGDTILGNMVPACGRCDHSKGDQPFDTWALGRMPGSPTSRGVADVDERLNKIRAYVAKYGYQPRTPEQRLNSEEMHQLEVLRSDLFRLRKDFDELIAVFRKRSGLR